MVIENGGKIETMSFWTTIWRSYNVLEIRHQYSLIPKYIFSYILCIFVPFISHLIFCFLFVLYGVNIPVNIKFLAQSNIFKPIFAAIFVTIGALKVKSV